MIPKETRERLEELVATLSRDEPANSEDAKEIAADITAILAELDMLEDLAWLRVLERLANDVIQCDLFYSSKGENGALLLAAAELDDAPGFWGDCSGRSAKAVATLVVSVMGIRAFLSPADPSHSPQWGK